MQKLLSENRGVVLLVSEKASMNGFLDSLSLGGQWASAKSERPREVSPAAGYFSPLDEERYRDFSWSLG